MVERCALSGSDLKIKFRTILLPSIYSYIELRGYESGSLADDLKLCISTVAPRSDILFDRYHLVLDVLSNELQRKVPPSLPSAC